MKNNKDLENEIKKFLEKNYTTFKKIEFLLEKDCLEICGLVFLNKETGEKGVDNI